MKATELRIGNLVKYNDGGIFKVIGIYNFGLDVEDDIEVTYMEYENFSAIPITEEWLLKFGFMEFKGGISLDNEEFTLTYTHKNTDKTILLEVTREDEWGRHQYTCIVLNHIKYVHQLQNLYFTLTGEEL